MKSNSNSTQIYKKTKPSDTDTDTDALSLILGLPNEIAERCLSFLPPSLLFSICRLWRRFIYSPSFPPFFSLYALVFPSSSPFNPVEIFSLDPFSTTWKPVPPPPPDPPLRLLHRHPSYLSRKLSIQSLAVSNNLVLIAGTCHQFLPALSSPLVFNPETKSWFPGPKLLTPRRWCAAGTVGGAVYVASGVGSRYQQEIAKSMEKWDLNKKKEEWNWIEKEKLKNGRFSREAVEAVGYKGKLCMVNVKGHAIKEGIIYDVVSDKWEEMPAGMLLGWKGAVASMNEEDMYVVDELSGVLSKYDDEKDGWMRVVEMAELKRTEHMTAGRGRIVAVCGNGERIVVVDVVSQPVRVWTVYPPRGFHAVSVHVLPRTIHLEE